MKKFKKILLAMLLFFYVVPMAEAVSAAYLKYDKTTVTVSNGGTFELAVQVEPSGDSISSVDAYVIYDATAIKVTNVAAGSLFPTVSNDTSTSGKVYIAGLVNDASSSITTAGTLATITFQALKESSSTVSFDCTSSKIIKNDINATNVINCSQNTTSAVTVGAGGGGGDVVPTTPPSELPQTGIWENMAKFAIPGAFLVLVGGLLRIILL